MLRCALDDHFELYEFPNDLARWCWETLGDRLLGEQIAIIDPRRCGSLNNLRRSIIDVIEERLWSVDRVPWCRPGLELHLIESRLIAFDTGERVNHPAAWRTQLPVCHYAHCSIAFTKPTGALGDKVTISRRGSKAVVPTRHHFPSPGD